MDPGVVGSYGPTLVRYIGVAIGLVIIMYLVYRVQIVLGVKREAATGRALVTPWVLGFLVFTVFTMGSSLYLSFTQYNLFRAPEWIGLDNYKELFSLSAGALQSRSQRSSDVLPRGQDEILRIEIGDGGFVLGAKRPDF